MSRPSKHKMWAESIRLTGIRLDRNSREYALFCAIDPQFPSRRIHLQENDDTLGWFHSRGTCDCPEPFSQSVASDKANNCLTA